MIPTPSRATLTIMTFSKRIKPSTADHAARFENDTPATSGTTTYSTFPLFLLCCRREKTKMAIEDEQMCAAVMNHCTQLAFFFFFFYSTQTAKYHTSPLEPRKIPPWIGCCCLCFHFHFEAAFDDVVCAHFFPVHNPSFPRA